jgi:tetratricopeptide (TPR) repeat protein
MARRVRTEGLFDEQELVHLVALAESARVRGVSEQALAGYRAALVVAPDDWNGRGLVHARIGVLERSYGRVDEARRAFELALLESPHDRDSLEALIEMAEEESDYERVVDLSRTRVALLEEPGDVVDALFAIAETLVRKLRDLPAAVEELEKARSIDPTRDDVLEALRRAYRVLEDWPQVIELTGALAELAPSEAERAARRFVQAKIAIERLEAPEHALPYLEAALDEDPTHDEALDVLVEVRTARGEVAELAATLTALAERLQALADDERAHDVQKRLAALRGEDVVEEPTLDDRSGERAVDLADADARLAVADKLQAAGDGDGALDVLEATAAQSPLHAPIYARLFDLHVRAGSADRAFLAAMALEELEQTDADQRGVVERCRTDELRVRAALDDAAWHQLRAPGGDDVIEALLEAIGRAAIATGIDGRGRERRIVTLDASRRLPAESTAMVVRSFHFTSRVLAVACPALYLVDEVPGGMAAVPVAEASTAVGRDALRGMSAKDVAFVVGRHLTYYRPEHAVLVHFPTLQELTVLVLAAVRLAMPGMEIPSAIAPAVEALVEPLSRHVSEREREKMSHAVEKLDARGGRIGLPSWIRSVELTAGRAGLLLCGDLQTAMSRIRDEKRATAHVAIAEKRADLLAFCASRELAELREWVTDAATVTRASLVEAL